MNIPRIGFSLLSFGRRALLPGLALFGFAVCPARAVHVLKFEVPAGNSNFVFFLDDPALNGKPTAKLTVTQRYGSASNNHPIGVWFVKTAGLHGMWGVFNEDAVNLPTGAAFNVLVGTHTTVNAGPANSVLNFTLLPVAVGKPPFTPAPPAGTKIGYLFFTHNFVPYQTLGSVGVVVARHQGLGYNSGPSPARANKWLIGNEDQSPAVAASYFVFDASTAPVGAVRYGHTSAAGNINTTNLDPDQTFLSNPALDLHPNAVVFITPVGLNAYDKSVGVFYNTSKAQWTIFNEDGSAFAAGKNFNVLVFPGTIP